MLNVDVRFIRLKLSIISSELKYNPSSSIISVCRYYITKGGGGNLSEFGAERVS